MNIADKANIISDFWDAYGSKPAWKNFFDYNDLGVPYAIGIAAGHILSLSPDGERFIEMTWDDLCRSAGVDPDVEYGSIGDFVMAARDTRV